MDHAVRDLEGDCSMDDGFKSSHVRCAEAEEVGLTGEAVCYLEPEVE